MTAAASLLSAPKTSAGANSASLTATADATVGSSPAGTPLYVLVWSSGSPITYNSTGHSAGTLEDSAGNVYTQIANIAETASASTTIALFECSPTNHTAAIVGGTTTLNVSTGTARPLGFEWIQAPGYGAEDVAVVTDSATSGSYKIGTSGAGLAIASGAQIIAFGATAMTGITAVGASGGGTWTTHILSAAGTSATRIAWWGTCIDGSGTVDPTFTETGGAGSANWATIALSLVKNTSGYTACVWNGTAWVPCSIEFIGA